MDAIKLNTAKRHIDLNWRLKYGNIIPTPVWQHSSELVENNHSNGKGKKVVYKISPHSWKTHKVENISNLVSGAAPSSG